jgi:hypothetical protein
MWRNPVGKRMIVAVIAATVARAIVVRVMIVAAVVMMKIADVVAEV